MDGLIQILPMLEQATDLRKINWQVYGEHGVVALLGENSLLADWYIDTDGDSWFYMELQNKNGEQIDRSSFYRGTERERILKLHEKAHRQARNVDEILSDVARELRNLLSR